MSRLLSMLGALFSFTGTILCIPGVLLVVLGKRLRNQRR